MSKQPEREVASAKAAENNPNKKINFQVSEAYKMIRTNLLFALSTTDNRTVVFSSAEPGVGKSTLSGNLAIVMAQTGAKVVLVDADMRKPSQHRNFRVSRSLGLSKILGGLNTLDECLCRDVKPNLDVITAGSIPPNPSELLGSSRMQELLAELQERYDYVFVDVPPLCVVADALVVAPATAGVVLVARCRQTTYDELSNAIENVHQADVPLLGVVMTCVEQEVRGYRSRYYRSYDYAYRESGKRNG